MKSKKKFILMCLQSEGLRFILVSYRGTAEKGEGYSNVS
jgi:hypothetical protein